MSKRTNIGRKIDAQRLAQLVSSPGIDPRVWVSICYVDKVVVDKDHGVFADVHLASTATLDDQGNAVAQMETVRVAADYAGNGFGAFFPPAEGDEVLVLWPDGNPDHGGILVKRLWSASDLPPQPAIDHPTDCVLMLGKDVNLRIIGQGKTNLVLQIDQGQVLLGNENAALKNARVTDPIAVGTLAGQAGPYPVVFTYLPTQNVQGQDVPGTPSSGPSVSLAGIISNGGGAAGVKS